MNRPPSTERPAPFSISLVIPAWNEAALLPRLLESVRVAQANYVGGVEATEVIVGDNASTDETAEIARAHGCRVVSVEKRCIAAARNGGAAAATGDVLAFADADFRLHCETFNFINAVMQTGRFVGGATGLTMERWSLGIRVTLSLVLPPLWLLGLDGGVWFCRRADFETLGGFNENVRAGEDVRFLTALKCLGRSRQPRQRMATRFTARSLGIPPATAINSARKFDHHGDWHMVRDVVCNLPGILLRGQQHIDRYVDAYWYQGR